MFAMLLINLAVSLLLVAAYRFFIIPHAIEEAVDEYQTEHDRVEVQRPPTSASVDAHMLLNEMIASHAETQKELLRLITVLAVRAAGAEQSVVSARELGREPIRSDWNPNSPADWSDLDKGHASEQRNYLAEQLRGIVSPDGGELVDP